MEERSPKGNFYVSQGSVRSLNHQDFDPEDLEKHDTQIGGTRHVDVGCVVCSSGLLLNPTLDDSLAEEDTTVSGEERTRNEKLEHSFPGSSDGEGGSQSESEGDDDDDDDNQSREPSPSKMVTPTDEQTEDISTVLKKSRDDDIRKGQAVKAQLVRYDLVYL